MRLTIGAKIFATAGALLALMIVAAVVSTWLSDRVADELDLVAEVFVPLSNHVAEIEVHVLEQEILLERLNHHTTDSLAGDEPSRELERFQQLREKVASELESAVAMARAGRSLVSEADAHDALEALALGLADIDRQHRHFHDGYLRIFELRREGRSELAEELYRLLANEEEELDAAVDSMRTKLAAFTADSAQEAEDDERRVLHWNAAVTAVAVVLGLVFAAAATRSMVRPVHSLRDGLREVEEGELREVMVTSGDEIGELARSFNHMVGELKVKQQIKDTFGKYLDPRVVEGILGDPGAARLTAEGGEKQLVSVFFSDIVGFTGLGERLTAAGLVRLINAYFELSCEPIVEQQGIIDKYIGDSVMAFWSPPFVEPGEQARLACLAALAQGDALRAFREQLPELLGLRRGLPPVDVRIGLATGEALVGNIGSRALKSFTVMGDTVNLGSRLEGVNKVYGTRVLMCERTRQMAGDVVESREIDAITVVGRDEAVRVHELLGRHGELADDLAAAREHFEDGLEAYRRRRWDDAAEAFTAADAARDGGDPPSRVFLDRLETLRRQPPDEGWDGVWRLHSK